MSFFVKVDSYEISIFFILYETLVPVHGENYWR